MSDGLGDSVGGRPSHSLLIVIIFLIFFIIVVVVVAHVRARAHTVGVPRASFDRLVFGA